MQLSGSPGGGGSGNRLVNSMFPSNISLTWEARVRWDWESFVNADLRTTSFTASCSRDASQAGEENGENELYT